MLSTSGTMELHSEGMNRSPPDGPNQNNNDNSFQQLAPVSSYLSTTEAMDEMHPHPMQECNEGGIHPNQMQECKEDNTHQQKGVAHTKRKQQQRRGFILDPFSISMGRG